MQFAVGGALGAHSTVWDLYDRIPQAIAYPKFRILPPLSTIFGEPIGECLSILLSLGAVLKDSLMGSPKKEYILRESPGIFSIPLYFVIHTSDDACKASTTHSSRKARHMLVSSCTPPHPAAARLLTLLAPACCKQVSLHCAMSAE